MDTISNNVVNFAEYKDRKEVEELVGVEILDVFDRMSEEEIMFLLHELEEIYGIEEPANDIGYPYQTIITFTPEGFELWDSDEEE